MKWGEAIAEAFAETRAAALEMTDTEQGRSNIALGRELERKVKVVQCTVTQLVVFNLLFAAR